MPTKRGDQTDEMKIYDDDADLLMEADRRSDRVIMLPAGDPRTASTASRIRIQWGQHLLSDLIARRYRSLICGVNHEDNSHGIISQLADILPMSQWNTEAITKHAKVISSAASSDSDVYVLKFDLDAVEVFALLRPRGQSCFTLDNLAQGFRIVTQMLDGRFDRLPTASVSFLGAKSNHLARAVDDDREPSFETVLRTMFTAGFIGDIYPPVAMWERAPTGVFASYPFPESLDDMRGGSS